MTDTRWLVVLMVACSGREVPKSTTGGPLPDDGQPTIPTTTTPPPTCDLDPPDGYPVAADPGCGTPIVGAFAPVTEWTWSENPLQPGYDQVMMTPTVVRLDPDQPPAIVFVAFEGSHYGAGGALTAIDGVDGTTRWSALDLGGAHPTGDGGVAVGDLDGDGRPEIVVPAAEGLLCVDADGGFEWLAPIAPDGQLMPAIGDLDGDGLAEVVAGRTVLEHDGTVRWTGTAGQGGGLHPASFPVDLDGDGRMEVVAGDTVYDWDGAVRREDGGQDGKPAVADFDGDGSPEIVVSSGNGEVRLVGQDGVVRWTWVSGVPGGGAPTLADFDGDGAPEVGIADTLTYHVLDADGTLLWSMPTEDLSGGLTSASVFDFDRNGALEVVYADEHTLWVFDGATGAVELQWDSHSSGSLHEYPVIADVDDDGSAEIVVPSNDYAWEGSHGITVIGDQTSSWAPARPIWNQHAYSVTNVDDDGGIPLVAAPNWATWNTFRAADLEPAPLSALADLALGEPQTCVDECGAGVVHLWVPVENRGLADSGAVTVTVSRADGATLTEVAALALAPIPAGSMAWAGPLALTAADYGADGLVVEARSDAAECDDTDDGWRSPAFPCP